MGLIINRAGSMTAKALARSQGIQPPTDALTLNVLEGGPVSREQGFILHSDDRTFEGSLATAPGILMSNTREALIAALGTDAPRHASIFLGYAGWGAGQLEQEIEENAWITAPASRTILFECPIDRRREKAAAGIGIDLRMYATRVGHG